MKIKLPELVTASLSQCDMPNSTFEEPPQSEFAAKCKVELPIDDNAVKPSIGVVE